MRIKRSPLYRIAAQLPYEIDDHCIEELRSLADNIERHPFKNLVAVIYYSLKNSDSLKHLPSELRKRLKGLYLNSISLDMRQRGWLENFIKNRLPEDIPIILMKGSANWGTIYSPEAPRTSCDIDLLVRDSDFETITRIMNSIAKKVILDESRIFSNRIAYEFAYAVEDYSTSVEIHRRISYPFIGNVDYNRLFDESELHPYYKDNRIRIMRPIDRLMHILIHSIKHADISTHEIVDTYLIIKKYRLDPYSIYTGARDYGLSQYSLHFLKEVFELMGEYEDFDIDKYVANKRIFRLSERVFNILHREEHRIGFRKRQLISLLLLDRMSNVYRFLNFYIGLRVRDALLYRYPEIFGYFYEK
jgi:hypothetical protein